MDGPVRPVGWTLSCWPCFLFSLKGSLEYATQRDQKFTPLNHYSKTSLSDLFTNAECSLNLMYGATMKFSATSVRRTMTFTVPALPIFFLSLALTDRVARCAPPSNRHGARRNVGVSQLSGVHPVQWRRS